MIAKPADDIVALIDNGKYYVPSETKSEWIEISENDFWTIMSELTQQPKEEFQNV